MNKNNDNFKNEPLNIDDDMSITSILDSIDKRINESLNDIYKSNVNDNEKDSKFIDIDDVLIDELIDKNINLHNNKLSKQENNKINDNIDVEKEDEKFLNENKNTIELVEVSEENELQVLKNSEVFTDDFENSKITNNLDSEKKINVKSQIDEKFFNFFGEGMKEKFEDEKTITKLKFELDEFIEKSKKENEDRLKNDYIKLKERRRSKVDNFNIIKKKSTINLEESNIDESCDEDILDKNIEQENKDLKEKKSFFSFFKKKKIVKSEITENSNSEEESKDFILNSTDQIDKFINDKIDEDELKQTTTADFTLDNEFVSYENKEAAFNYIKFQKSGLLFDCIFSLITFLITLLVVTQNIFKLNISPIIDISNNVYTVNIVLFACILFNVFINAKNIILSTINIFLGQGDSDSTLSLSLIFTSLALFFCFKNSYAVDNIFLVCISLSILSLFLNTIMKYISINRIIQNFEIISDEEVDKYIFTQLKNEILVSQITAKLNEDDYVVGMKSKRNFIHNFVKQSFDNDYYDSVSKKLSIFCVVFSIFVVGIASYYLTVDVNKTLINIAVSITLMTPINGMGSITLILKKLQNREDEEKSFICSYKSIENISKTNCIILNDNLIFDKDHISITGIKTFDDNVGIDDIIIYVSSIFSKSSSALTDVFLEVIENNDTFLLDVDDLKYENAMGYSAYVDGNVVLVGNRNLLINHSVSVLKKEVEDEFLDDNKSVVYVSVNSKVSAVFVLQYTKNEKVEKYLNKLIQNDITVAIRVSDPSVNPEKVESLYSYPKEGVTIINSEIHNEIDNEENQKSFCGDYVFNGDDYQYMNIVNESCDIVNIIKSSIFIQVLICVFITSIHFISNVVFNFSILTPFFIIILQLISLISSLISPLFIHKNISK